MNKAQQKRFNSLYQQHLNALIRQGKAQRTIDNYSRAVCRITEFYDQYPDNLTLQQLRGYFLALVKSDSWSTVKVDRNGLQFFYEHVLGKQWTWVDIVKAPQVRGLPDILTVKEVERIIIDILDHYRPRLLAQSNSGVTNEQRSGVNALLGCHTEQYGTMQLTCQSCAADAEQHLACGHRVCNRCQHHNTRQWLDRQQQKLLPVHYFMVTFTLPYSLRSVAKRHPQNRLHRLVPKRCVYVKRLWPQ